jgi:hypothetical protein
MDERDFDELHQHVARRFWGQVQDGRRRLDESLTVTAQQLSKKHKITDVTAHRGLLKALRDALVEYASWPTLELANWSIPKDLTPWKEARIKLTRFAVLLGEARRLSDEIVDDAVMMGALVHVDTDRLPDLIGSLYELDVEPQDVVPGQAESADGCFIIDAGMWPKRWPRLSEQFLRIDKWRVCRG